MIFAKCFRIKVVLNSFHNNFLLFYKQITWLTSTSLWTFIELSQFFECFLLDVYNLSDCSRNFNFSLFKAIKRSSKALFNFFKVSKTLEIKKVSVENTFDHYYHFLSAKLFNYLLLLLLKEKWIILFISFLLCVNSLELS